MSTQPGVTSKPSASMVRVAPPSTCPTSVMRPPSTATSACRASAPVPSTSVPPLMIRSCMPFMVSRRPAGRPPADVRLQTCRRCLNLGLAQDAVHLRAARGARALGGPPPVGQLDLLPVELPLLAALHAVPLVVRHGSLLWLLS